MKSFFLTFLLLYLSAFPSATPQPVVEIYEEIIHLVHEKEIVPAFVPRIHLLFFTEFSEHLVLIPQFDPHPELRPPRTSTHV